MQTEDLGSAGRVVVGVHGSASSLRALRHAVAIAVDRGWDLEIVTAWPDADDPLIHDVPGRYITARGRAMEYQRQALSAVDVPSGVCVETFLVNARPTEALLARCGAADLLVVGAGRPTPERGRLGVAAECVEAAPCPVTVVADPPRGPAQGSRTRIRTRNLGSRSRDSVGGAGRAAPVSLPSATSPMHQRPCSL
jgi:nucleotide-binding universal stress UspA family protein